MSNQYYKSVPKQLTPEDKKFIKLVHAGMNRTKAYREAYPDSKVVKRYMDIKSQGDVSEETARQRKHARELITVASKHKLQAQYIQKAMTTYQDSMEKYSELSVQTAIELVQNARSEKVRADLAIEGMRQKVGTPVQKVQVQEDRKVVISFGRPKHLEDANEIIEGEVVGRLDD